MWEIGKIPVCWNTDYRYLAYHKQDVKESESDMWRGLGYNHDSFTGEMYGGSDPMPEWVYKVSEQIGIKNCGFVFYRMKTLDIMPVHVDHFETYTKLFNVSRERVSRAVIFLEDWCSGHYFEINNTGYVNWQAGNYVIWSADEPHSASNIGISDRYTLQITGERDGKS